MQRNRREHIGLSLALILTAALVIGGNVFAHVRDARYAAMTAATLP